MPNHQGEDDAMTPNYTPADHMTRDVLSVVDTRRGSRLVWEDIQDGINHEQCHAITQSQLRSVVDTVGPGYIQAISASDWHQLVIMAAVRGDSLGAIIRSHRDSLICSYTHPATSTQSVEMLNAYAQLGDQANALR